MPDMNMQTFEELQRHQLVTEFDIQSQSELDDYQVKLDNVDNPTQAQDNLVVDVGGEALTHWNESIDFDTWIKMKIEASGNRGFLIHGNDRFSSGSSISDTFIDGSDFTDLTSWTQQAGTWTVSGGVLQIPESGANNYYLKRDTENPLNTDYIVGLRLKIDENTIGESQHRLAILLNSPSTLSRSSGNTIMWHEESAGSQRNRLLHDVYATVSYTEISDYQSHTWLYSEVQITDAEDKITLWSDDKETNYGNHTTSNTKDGGDFWGVYSGYSKGEIDYIFIRKYTTIEPTVQTSTPKNISTALKSFGRAG